MLLSGGLRLPGIYTTITSNLPPPLSQGYEQLLHLGHIASHRLGRSQALDNLVLQDYTRHIEKVEAAESVLRASNDLAVAAGELAVVRQFSEIYGARDQSQLLAIDPSAPPEPLALKQLERLMAAEIPEPDPQPFKATP